MVKITKDPRTMEKAIMRACSKFCIGVVSSR